MFSFCNAPFFIITYCHQYSGLEIRNIIHLSDGQIQRKLHNSLFPQRTSFLQLTSVSPTRDPPTCSFTMAGSWVCMKLTRSLYCLLARYPLTRDWIITMNFSFAWKRSSRSWVAVTAETQVWDENVILSYNLIIIIIKYNIYIAVPPPARSS